MQKAKLDKMKEDGKDEHDVKKMGEVTLTCKSFVSNTDYQVLQETLMMIPDCHRRIVAAKGELEQLLETEVCDAIKTSIVQKRNWNKAWRDCVGLYYPNLCLLCYIEPVHSALILYNICYWRFLCTSISSFFKWLYLKCF